MTANTLKDDKELSIEARVDDYIFKTNQCHEVKRGVY